MNPIVCPTCGSSDVNQTTYPYFVSEPYSEPRIVQLKNYVCNNCEMEGDFVGENDAIIEAELREAKFESIGKIIDDFQSVHFSQAAIERALDLPQRTLTKWKSGASEPSAAGVSLLRIIRTYPWVIEVAQKNYRPDIAHSVFIKSAVDAVVELSSNVIGDAPFIGMTGSKPSNVMFVYVATPAEQPRTGQGIEQGAWEQISPEVSVWTNGQATKSAQTARGIAQE